MAIWNTYLSVIVRNLIGDMSDSQVFDDSRLYSAICTGGLIAAQEYYFKNQYTFDLAGLTITPDPCDPNSLEPIAMALFSLKAACILTMNNYQGAVAGGIKVRDGDSEVDTTSAFKGYRDIIELGPCGSYQKMVRESSMRASMLRGKAITSPITHDKFLIQGFSFPLFWDSFVIR